MTIILENNSAAIVRIWNAPPKPTLVTWALIGTGGVGWTRWGVRPGGRPCRHPRLFLEGDCKLQPPAPAPASWPWGEQCCFSKDLTLCAACHKPENQPRAGTSTAVNQNNLSLGDAFQRCYRDVKPLQMSSGGGMKGKTQNSPSGLFWKGSLLL